MQETIIWLPLLVFLVAGTIKGTVGIGLPTAAISVLTQFYPPHTAIALVIFPILISNFWQMYRSGDIILTVQRYWRFASVLVVGILIFTQISSTLPTSLLMLILGLAIVLFSLTSLFVQPPTLPDRFDRPGQLIAGSLAGVLGGLTAIWSPPMVIYLLARRVEKDNFVRATGFLISVGSLPLLLGYWHAGLMTPTLATSSLLMIFPTLLGFSLGERIRRRFDAQVFQKALLILFLIMGLNIIRRALF